MDAESEISVIDLVSSADEEAVDRKGRLKMMVQLQVYGGLMEMIVRLNEQVTMIRSCKFNVLLTNKGV